MSSNPTSGNKTLNYRLRTNQQGICLDVWEDSHAFTPGEASYRFFVTYQLKSADDAQAILDRYLIANDMYHAVPSNDAVTPIHLRTLAGSQS